MAKQATQQKPAASKAPVAYINPNALSLDIGRKAVEAWGGIYETAKTIKDMTEENEQGKKNTLGWLTAAFVKAAKADNSIKLEDVHSDVKANSEELKRKLEVAVGIRIVQIAEDGVKKFPLADWTKDIFTQPGEKADNTPNFKEKENFRTNFATGFKKAMMTAHGMVVKNISFREDKGKLLISGKAVQERFKLDSAQDEIEVSSDKTRVTADGKKVKLDKVPSFTEIGRMGAETLGKTIQTRVQSAATATGGAMTETAIASNARAMTETLKKIKNPGDELKSALEALRDEIGTLID